MSFPPPLAGWDEGEALEFSKALKQPMVLQTPLQASGVLLEWAILSVSQDSIHIISTEVFE
eukprot:1162074-Pelagomonas_calceolata.AAC.15